MGHTDKVTISEGLGADSRGFSIVEVRWRSGLSAYSTHVVEARPVGTGRRAAARTGAPIVDDVAEHLLELQPDLRVEPGERVSGPSFELLGREQSGWLVLLYAGAFFGTLVLLIAGPEPRRATRWAWFWLLTSVLLPLTAVAFLVAGGSARLVADPREGERRLTRGWAFLISWFVTGAIVQNGS